MIILGNQPLPGSLPPGLQDCPLSPVHLPVSSPLEQFSALAAAPIAGPVVDPISGPVAVLIAGPVAGQVAGLVADQVAGPVAGPVEEAAAGPVEWAAAVLTWGWLVEAAFVVVRSHFLSGS